MDKFIAIGEDEWDRVCQVIRYVEKLRASSDLKETNNDTVHRPTIIVKIKSSTQISPFRWAGLMYRIDAYDPSLPPVINVEEGIECDIISMFGKVPSSRYYFGLLVDQNAINGNPVVAVWNADDADAYGYGYKPGGQNSIVVPV